MRTTKRFARCVCGRQIRKMLFIVLSRFNNQKFVLSRTGARDGNVGACHAGWLQSGLRRNVNR